MSLNSFSFIGDVHIIFFAFCLEHFAFLFLENFSRNESIKLVMFSFYHTLWEIEYQLSKIRLGK